MEKYEIKEVPFMGANLMAARDTDGQIWTGVKLICKGIGLNRSLADNQVQKVQTDKILKQGVRRFPAGVFDLHNETIGMKLDYIPIWLAKINTTARMEREVPKLAQKLSQYQLKVKDALTKAFLPQDVDSDCTSSLRSKLLKDVEANQKRQEQAIKEIDQKIENLRKVVALSSDSWRLETQELIFRIAEAIGGEKYIKDVNEVLFLLLNKRAGVSLSTRLINKRRRMAEEGVCKSERDKLNYIDIIAEDKKLIHVYIAIVREMAAKCSTGLRTV